MWGQAQCAEDLRLSTWWQAVMAMCGSVQAKMLRIEKWSVEKLIRNPKISKISKSQNLKVLGLTCTCTARYTIRLLPLRALGEIRDYEMLAWQVFNFASMWHFVPPFNSQLLQSHIVLISLFWSRSQISTFSVTWIGLFLTFQPKAPNLELVSPLSTPKKHRIPQVNFVWPFP